MAEPLSSARSPELDALLATARRVIDDATATWDRMGRFDLDNPRNRGKASPSLAVLMALVPALDAALARERQDAERLRGVIERERTITAEWGHRIKAECSRWWGMATSRGSYEWDDDRYREEFSRALERITAAADRMLKDTNAHSWTDCPTTQAAVDAARSPLEARHE